MTPEDEKELADILGNTPPAPVNPHTKKPFRKVNPKARPHVGRPSLYNPDYHNDLAFNLTLLGRSREEIAHIFGISRETLYAWEAEYPDFSDSIRSGGDIADAKISRRLFDRAYGQYYTTEEAKVTSDGAGMGSSIEKVKLRKYLPGDVEAMKFWLTNRQKKLWRNKTETGVTDVDGNDVLPEKLNLEKLSEQELIMLYTLQKKAAGE